MSATNNIPQIEKLTSLHEVKKFKCGEHSLDLFIRRHALNNQLTDSSQTYVAHSNQVVIGYYTLVYGNISLDDCPHSIREGMPSAFPVPVMVFARWAVDQNEQHKGIGRALLKDAFLRTAAAADIGGLRAILVDALNEKMVMEYKNLGFIECPVGERKLMISIQDVRAGLG
jgi:hypothetical protein